VAATRVIEVVSDANVVLKWFHAEGEEEVEPARALLEAHKTRRIALSVLDQPALEHLLNLTAAHPRRTQQLAWECWNDTRPGEAVLLDTVIAAGRSSPAGRSLLTTASRARPGSSRRCCGCSAAT